MSAAWLECRRVWRLCRLLCLRFTVFSRRKAMKGRLYFATKAQKDGKILIKTHPCAQIFCCDICGFEKVSHLRSVCTTAAVFFILAVTRMHRLYLATGWHSNLKRAAAACRSLWTQPEHMSLCFSTGRCRTVLQRVRGKMDG